MISFLSCSSINWPDASSKQAFSVDSSLTISILWICASLGCLHLSNLVNGRVPSAYEFISNECHSWVLLFLQQAMSCQLILASLDVSNQKGKWISNLVQILDLLQARIHACFVTGLNLHDTFLICKTETHRIIHNN